MRRKTDRLAEEVVYPDLSFQAPGSPWHFLNKEVIKLELCFDKIILERISVLFDKGINHAAIEIWKQTQKEVAQNLLIDCSLLCNTWGMRVGGVHVGTHAPTSTSIETAIFK